MHRGTKNSAYFNVVTCLLFVCMVVEDVSTLLDSCDKTRRVFTDSWGVITDGPLESNYTQDSHCEWLIKANGSDQFITLNFRTMGTECSYDYVFVYDGDSFRSPLLGSFSGKTSPQKVIAKSGYMLILLYSDTNYVLNGFRAEFSVTDCPNNCSRHGFCYNHQCACENDWGGDDCSYTLCPESCGKDQHHGHCESGKCICEPGYSGSACSLHNSDSDGNKWHWLSDTGRGLAPRAAHTAIYLEEIDALYVYGGYDLNRVLGTLEIYNFKNSTWTNPAGEILEDKTINSQFDPVYVAALLEHVGPDYEEKWGLHSKSSLLRSILHSYADTTNATRRSRHIRSIHSPAPRYGHAACAIPDGFLIYGGKLDNGSLSNELWSYDVHSKAWTLRALNSSVAPPALTRHSLTAVEDYIYLFGGSTTDGEFSSKLFRIRLDDEDEDENWEYVRPRGGKELDVRVVAHSTVYHAASNSLLVYGGVVAGVARFSKLSDRMFAFHLESRHWTEIHYPREHLREKFVPRERAFHTANIIGNYLIVFGGYSHRHNKEEICYDNQMYLYHLGCHAWVNPDILGENQDSLYPKQQGVFAHAAAVRNLNTLLLIGGYHGNVNGDLLAYTVPPMVAARKGDHYEPEIACGRHKKYQECAADPECGWCSVDEQCYGRTVGANCTTNLQTTRCPGVCPALGDCHSCLIHGKPAMLVSAAHKLGLGDCTWCVQNARCHHKDDNYGVCGLREDTPSQVPGWWGVKGTEVHLPEDCRERDKRPGLTFLRYHHPVNWSQPDNVAIINATTVDFSPLTSPMQSKMTQPGEMVSRLLGFLRPPNHWQGIKEKLKICVTYCNATLKLSHGNEKILQTNLTSENKQECKFNELELSQFKRISLDFESHKTITMMYSSHQQSKMELQHYRESENPKVFTFEYLEPYANGTCAQYTNCLHCLTDSLCGWCELSSTCVSRDVDEKDSCSLNDDWRYLTLLPGACSNCSNYISCEHCVNTRLCEWWVKDARCARIGMGTEGTIMTEEKCPVPCYMRSDCNSCLDIQGRCVWCEATQQCFSFSVYTSEYQFGLCREWLDQTSTAQETSVIPAHRQDQCKSCQSHTKCATCLSYLSCGWCYSSENPIHGVCVQGDFNHALTPCEHVLNMTYAKWAYAQCPDVDECGLGLHDCHKEAICTNTDGSFSCKCRQGFEGDGKVNCTRTCDHPCVNGRCLGYPDYKCECNLGWTGENCSIDCGCNMHSNCTQGIEICDSCQDWTTGEYCELCLEGSYGNATGPEGCQKCNCNDHGNVTEGVCDIVTGVCHCQDNTEGKNCERCRQNYYGNPKNGGQCYYQCEARGMLTDSVGQGISSRQAYTSPWGGPPTRECLWIISPNEQSSIIQLQVNASQLNVTCGENAVYVYDGMPELADTTQQSALMAVFCKEDARPSMIVETKSGHLTVHYKQGVIGEGFNAIYKILNCGNCQSPRECRNNQCVCIEGHAGPECKEIICPNNCGSLEKRGECDHSYGRCLCIQGWGGIDCSQKLNGSQIIFTELFNTQNLASQVEHLRKTLPRFGHSLVADHRRGLWMFGGYSLSHGPLNDIRLFDILNNTWMQVTVDSTPDAKMPQGRYYHAADIVHSRQAIYVYGGLTKHVRSQLNENVLKDLWQFDLHNQRWNEIISNDQQWPPPLAGHTLTCYRNASYDSLILIGGFSPQFGFLSIPWEYRLDKGVWVPLKTRGKGPLGVFGHSTVFHSPTNSLYVFGGYHYTYNNRTILSQNLYALRYNTLHWINLHAFGEYSSPLLGIPHARFLHSAVTTDNYMLVFGGRMSPWNYTNSFFAYLYNCSKWINLISEDIYRVGPLPTQTYAQAMTFENGTIYIVGGWGSESQCKVTKISLPEDLCELWSSSKYKCLQYRGCGYCSSEQPNGTNFTHCHSNFKSTSSHCEASNGTIKTNNGQTCDGLLNIHCNNTYDCASCLQSVGCQWCPGCGGKCVALEQQCYKSDICGDEQRPFNNSLQCLESQCLASDCVQCNQLEGCYWSKRADEYQKSISYWQCSKSNKLRRVTSEDYDQFLCENSCVNHTDCADCLGTLSCHWSTQLNECISINHQPLYCSGGVCGLVLQSEDKDYCPEPCESFTQCSTCLRHAHCGWCAIDDEKGVGVCSEGSTDKPLSGTCQALYMKHHNIPDTISHYVAANFTWNYVRCPPENECLNDHHSCNRDSEICVDLRDGFKCECGEGYHSTDDGCMPVCSQGCVRGVCVQPNQCQCDFGYVGANCSIECQCNGHSNCAGPDKLDACLECHNNTMGEQCELCMPLFVGNPKNRERCIPCLEYCNGHSYVCISENTTEPEGYANMTLSDLKEYLKVGPVGKAKCVRCSNKTQGNKCDECVRGNYRGSTILTASCKPCNCHGHGDMCDPVTGDKCNCRNNTESNTTCQAKHLNQDCSEMQCIKCKDTYMGTPTDGHQCYKQMTVDSKMCFDAKLIDECKMKPEPLRPGETVFFVVQPRFMNVDIRITIDVTQGSLDLFLSNRDDTFVVFPNMTAGVHDVSLDSRYNKSLSSSENEDKNKYSWLEYAVQGLRTYITIPSNSTLLRVRGLKDRLVITLPQERHRLDTTKFYIVLQALPSGDQSMPSIPSYGMVFSRQDQLHIDLFVFFSVFFSCFFLFLAACVVAWKAKQAADVRRARRRHVVEMLHLAQRPFASVNLFLGLSTPVCSRRAKPRRIPLGDLRPVAVEPTDDGIAAVATVFVSLPGGQSANVKLALASSLILLVRQYPSGGRAFLRRRSNHAPLPPT